MALKHNHAHLGHIYKSTNDSSGTDLVQTLSHVLNLYATFFNLQNFEFAQQQDRINHAISSLKTAILKLKAMNYQDKTSLKKQKTIN